MRVEAFLADSVTNAEGKLYVLGAGWNLLNTHVLPFVQDRIGIGLIFRVAYAETNQIHKFEVYLVDADGHELQLTHAADGGEIHRRPIHRLGGQFNLGRPAVVQPGDEQLIAVAMNLNNLELTRADGFAFKVEVDGMVVQELPFRVNHLVQTSPTPG